MSKITDWLETCIINIAEFLCGGYVAGGVIRRKNGSLYSKFPNKGILVDLPPKVQEETDREKLERIYLE